MLRLLIVFMLTTLVGCSSIRPLSKGEMRTADGVEWGETGEEFESIPELIPDEETVRLGDRGGDVYQKYSKNEFNSVDIARKTRVGLALGPALYRSNNYVSLLKFLDKEGLSPKAITGTEFGAVVAAMYASGMTPEVIEWNFYRYLREKRNHQIFSKEWIAEIDEILLSKISAKKIEDTKIKFYLTLYNPQTKKTYFFEKGNMRELLKMNLMLSGTFAGNKKNKKVQYTSAIESEVINSKILSSVGVDFKIGADVIPDELNFVDANEYVITIYGKALGQLKKESKKFDYYYRLGDSSMKLDTSDDGPKYLLNTNKFIKTNEDRFKKVMHEKYIQRDSR